MKDNKRQARVIELDRKVREALSNRGKSKTAAAQDPDGFLEGALLNKDVSAAHDRFIADVEVRAVVGKGSKKRLFVCQRKRQKPSIARGGEGRIREEPRDNDPSRESW